MAIERTFALIKKHVFVAQAKAITEYLSAVGLRIVTHNSFLNGYRTDLFSRLYQKHKEQPYHEDLLASVGFGTVALVLEGENAIRVWRDAMGPTDPVRARAERPASIRALFGGEALPDNAVHGSDSPESAAREIALFFPDLAHG